MSVRVETEVDWDSLKVFCNDIWGKRKTHNRREDFYEHLGRQPTLNEPKRAVARVVNEKGETEGLVALLRFGWRGKKVYSAANWYTKPKVGSGNMHGALLLSYWQKSCDVMVAAHPRTNLAPMFSRAGWKRVDAQTFWLPLGIGGLEVIWPGRRRWKMAMRMVGEYVVGLMRSRGKFKGRIEEVDIGEWLNKWLVKAGESYSFFDRSLEYMRWQYESWQPEGQRWRTYRVVNGEGEVVGWFELRTGKKMVVVCELMALTGEWELIVRAVEKVAKNIEGTTVVRLRTNVAECLTAIERLNWVRGLPIATFIRGMELPEDLVLSPGDSDEYLL